MYTLDKLVFNLFLFSLLRYSILIVGHSNGTEKYEEKKYRPEIPAEMTIIDILIIFPYMREKEKGTWGVCVCICGISGICFLLKDMTLYHFLIISFGMFGLCNRIAGSLMAGVLYHILF